MSDAYIVKSFRVPESVLNGFDALIGPCSVQLREFYAHVYACTLINPYGSVPISRRLIDDHWGKHYYERVDWKSLVDARLLEVTDYSVQEHKSYTFNIPSVVLNALDYYWPLNTEAYLGQDTFNLMTGKLMRPARHVLTTQCKHSLPDLIKNAIQSIEFCPFNDTAIAEMFSQKYPQGPGIITDPKELATYYVDKVSYDTMRLNNLQYMQAGLYKYDNSFRAQGTGRITEEGRGLQSCTREMKAAAFSNIPGICNYDLESSQAWILVQFFEDAGLNTQWLLDYLSQGKEPYYTAVGVDKDTWKHCFMALIFGSCCPKVIKDESQIKSSAILNYLWEYAAGNFNKLKELARNFNEVTQPLIKNLDVWHEWTLTEYLNKNSCYSGGRHTSKNPTGMVFRFDHYKDKKGKFNKFKKAELKRKFSAFLLQGVEAAFIHNLTILQIHGQFKVLSNQHDGLVTQGSIPQEAIDIAKQNSGLRYATLIEKPFV